MSRLIPAMTYLMAVMLISIPLMSQTPAPAPAANATKKTWTLPRTPDGQPDLSGVWTNASIVPLQRPEKLGAKEFYTQQEVAENAKHARGDRPDYSAVQYDLSQFGLQTHQQKIAPSTRTSLIIGPEGRIPPLTPDGQKRAAEFVQYMTGHEFDSAEMRPLQERCILAPDIGPPMLPAGYNSNLQIVQSANSIAILQEMIHDVRIIPLEKRPQLPQDIRQRRGDPVGHWEGNTLVVESTNFMNQSPIRSRSVAGIDRHFGFPVVNMRVVERFTRTDADTILYQFTIEDPATWTKPWSGELVISKMDTPIFEYGCHEGNYGMPDTLSGERVKEQEGNPQDGK